MSEFNRYIPKNNLVESVNDICQAISEKIKRNGKLGNHALNVFLEQNFIDIYNIAFGLLFEKCEGPNFPGIDLLNDSKTIGLQISSETSINKIKKTFVKYYKNQEKLKDIKKLKFFFLSQDSQKLKKISISQIEKHLSTSAKLKEINRNRVNRLTKIEINPELFNASEDILCFSFINNRYNELNNDALDRIIKILEDVWSYYKISTDDISNFHSNWKLTSINEKLDILPKKEAIQLISITFLPLNIIPYHILTSLHYSGKKIGYEVSQFTLKTDNKDLFDDAYSEFDNKNKPLINFLLRNKIHKIKLWNKNREISINQFYNNSKSCLICDYDDFRIDTKLLYDVPTKEVNIENLKDCFYKANFYAEYGQYQKAIDQLNSIWSFTNNTSYHLASFICLYILRRLKNSQYLRLKEDSPIFKLPQELINAIERDFSLPIKDGISLEEIKVMDYFYHFKHINNQDQILDLIKETDKAIKIDNNGNYFSKNITTDWYLATFNAVYISKHNYLLFDTKFSEISQIVHKTFDSILTLSLIRHERSPKPHLWDTFIKYTLIYLSETELKESLLYYKKISPIFKDEKNLNIIEKVLTNVISNIHSNKNELLSYFKAKSNNNFSLSDNINQAFRNVCLYYSSLNFGNDIMNENLTKLLEISATTGYIWPSSYRLLIDLINKRQAVITTKNTDLIKTLYETKSEIFLELDLYCGSFIDLQDFDYNNAHIDTLFNLWFYRQNEINKDKIKEAFGKLLTDKYSFHDLWLGVITDLIEFEPYKNKTIEYLSDILHDKFDFHLNEWIVKSFLEIAFHQDLNLALPEYQKLKPKSTKEEDYYSWLFNLASYDYSRFNPYWLLKYPYDIFLNKFKAIPEVKEKLIAHLKENEDAKLSHLYFKHFMDN